VVHTGIVGLGESDFEGSVSIVRWDILAFKDVTIDRASTVVRNNGQSTEESKIIVEARGVGENDPVGKGHIECLGESANEFREDIKSVDWGYER
jgi:hypothetical protein